MGTSKRNVERPLAVVTGASSGIGLELAFQFAQNNYDLILAAEDMGIRAAASAVEKFGVEAEPLQVDLSRPDGVNKLYQVIKDSGRVIDCLALNAGVGVGGEFARDTRLEDEINLIQLNIISTVHLCKLVVQDMVRVGKGKILFTSSVAALLPGAYSATYNASKAFIESFAEAIRNELKGSGVSVTSLMPGATETNFFHRAGMDDTKVGISQKDDPALVAKQGFDALMEGKDHVVGGSFMNRVQNTVAKILPDKVKAQMHAKTAKPGSGRKTS